MSRPTHATPCCTPSPCSQHTLLHTVTLPTLAHAMTFPYPPTPTHRGASGYMGVCWDKRKQRWFSQIQQAGRRRFLGYFTTDQEAAAAYDRSAAPRALPAACAARVGLVCTPGTWCVCVLGECVAVCVCARARRCRPLTAAWHSSPTRPPLRVLQGGAQAQRPRGPDQL
jgi:hypothetical protein